MSGTGDSAPPRVALLHWGDLIEDFLDTIGLSFEGFRDGMTGGWMFGYVDALERAGVETVIVCVTAEIERAERHRHRNTGAALWRVPASRTYLALRRLAAEAPGRPRSLHGRLARQAAPYLATPLRSLAAVLRDERCKALLCQEYEHPRFDACVLLGRMVGLPVFATFQGGSVQAYRLERWTRPLALRTCRGVVVSTEQEAFRVRARYGVPEHKLARIPNPFDAEAWRARDHAGARADLGLDPSALVVAWHGRIDVHVKGLDVLLDAWRELKASWGDEKLRLLLVGTGEDAGVLRELLSDRASDGVVWIDEYVLESERRRLYLSAADVYCLPSRREGFPVALLEAMACGLPVVAAEGNGTAEIFPDGEESGGLIVPREDPASLAAALDRLLRDEALRQALGERARERVEHAFSPDMVGQQLRGVLLGERAC